MILRRWLSDFRDNVFASFELSYYRTHSHDYFSADGFWYLWTILDANCFLDRILLGHSCLHFVDTRVISWTFCDYERFGFQMKPHEELIRITFVDEHFLASYGTSLRLWLVSPHSISLYICFRNSSLYCSGWNGTHRYRTKERLPCSPPLRNT